MLTLTSLLEVCVGSLKCAAGVGGVVGWKIGVPYRSDGEAVGRTAEAGDTEL